MRPFAKSAANCAQLAYFPFFLEKRLIWRHKELWGASVMGVKKAEFGLVAELISDIEDVFDGEKAICERVNVARDTWLKIKGKTGIKKEKATSVVKRFFNILMKSTDDVRSDNDILDQYFIVCKEKYINGGIAPSPDSYVVKLEA